MNKKRKMSRWGVGPVFAVLSIGYGGIMLGAGVLFYPALQLTGSSNRLIMAAGIALIIVGIPFWLQDCSYLNILKNLTKI